MSRTYQVFKKYPQKTYIYVFVIALVLIPIVNILVLLIRHSVNVPWWDQLSFVDLMFKLHHGNLSIYDLWKQHNEHRILFPQVFELTIGEVTNFNFRVPVIFNFLMSLGSFSILGTMFKKTFPKSNLPLLLAIPIAWLMFSPIQWTNWIWGFQLAFFMSVFFAILTIWLINHRNFLTSNKLLIWALVTASITTYCNGNGLLIWPIGLVIILKRRVDYKWVLAWCSVGLGVISSYLFKFHRSPDSPPLSIILKEPVAVAKYALAYLGRNLAITPITSRYVGAVLVIVMAISTFYIYKKGKLNNILGWLGVAAYSFLTAILAAISRLNFGIDHGFISNSYPTISVLFIVATLVVSVFALSLLLKSNNRHNLSIIVPVLIIFGALCALPLPAFFKNYTTGTADLKDLGHHLSSVQNCVYTVTSHDDNCLLKLFPNKSQSWNYVQELKSLHWGDFK